MTLFLAYFYGRNSWLQHSFNQYDDDDYVAWTNEASLDFAARATAAGIYLRQLLGRADAFYFNHNLGC